jgi:tetratricopeptide (TPR) repeat protein
LQISQYSYKLANSMKISRKIIALGLAVLVLVALGIYGGLYFKKNAEKNKYSGLVTQKDIDLEESARVYFEDRLATTQAAIAAAEAAGEEVDLNLYLSAAADAYAIGDLVTSRELLEKQLEANSVYTVAWNNYAIVLQDMGDYYNAQVAYQRALELDPTYAKYWDDYANFLQAHRPEDVQTLKALYESNLQLLGQTTWNMVGLAGVYAVLGDCTKGVEHYEVAAALEPNNQALQDDFKRFKDQCQE